MSNFFDDEIFDAQAPTGTIEHVLVEIRCNDSEDVVLTLRHAGESNAEYMNAKRKLDLELRAYGGDVPEMVMRQRLIPLFAAHVVAGWRNVRSRTGTVVACSPEAVEEMLTKLFRKNPDKVGRVMVAASAADSFRGLHAQAVALGNG